MKLDFNCHSMKALSVITEAVTCTLRGYGRSENDTLWVAPVNSRS